MTGRLPPSHSSACSSIHLDAYGFHNNKFILLASAAPEITGIIRHLSWGKDGKWGCNVLQ